MGGITIEIKGFKETRKWGSHSSNIADFLRLKDIELVSEGDTHDGVITFDPVKRTITINSDYFDMPYKAIKFWRNIGFSVIFQGETEWG